MSEKTYLFIGGAHDGERIGIGFNDPPETYILTSPVKPTYGNVEDAFVQEGYVRKILTGENGKKHYVYVTEDFDPIEQLILGYRHKS